MGQNVPQNTLCRGRVPRQFWPNPPGGVYRGRRPGVPGQAGTPHPRGDVGRAGKFRLPGTGAPEASVTRAVASRLAGGMGLNRPGRVTPRMKPATSPPHPELRQGTNRGPPPPTPCLTLTSPLILYLYLYLYTYTEYLYLYIPIYTYTCVYIYTHIYTYIYTHIHIYTCTHTHIPNFTHILNPGFWG